jgi:hypothetical protein
VLVVYARSDAGRRLKVAERLADFGPKLLESDLPHELEQQVQDEMKAAMKQASAASGQR